MSSAFSHVADGPARRRGEHVVIPLVLIEARVNQLRADLVAAGHEPLALLLVSVVRDARGELQVSVPGLREGAPAEVPAKQRAQLAAMLRGLADSVADDRRPRAFVLAADATRARAFGNSLLAAGAVAQPADVRFVSSPAHVPALVAEGDRVFHLPGAERRPHHELTLRAFERVERQCGTRLEHVHVDGAPAS